MAPAHWQGPGTDSDTQAVLLTGTVTAGPDAPLRLALAVSGSDSESESGASLALAVSLPFYPVRVPTACHGGSAAAAVWKTPAVIT